MANLKNVIYLSNEDYETLVSTGTVTIGGETLTYDENNVYVTPDKLVTTTEDGLMSAADKSKLDNIESGAEVNVQADWNQTNTSADDYIKNKPSIPTVNNGTLSIQGNGTTASTFTANQSGNTTLNIKGGGATTVTKSANNEITVSTPSVTDTNQTVKGNGTAFGSNDAIDIVGAGTVTVTADTTNKKITITGSAHTTDHNQTVKGNGTTFGVDAAVNIVGSGATTVTADTTNNKITINTPSVTNTNQTVKVGSTTFGANDAVGFVAGSNITSITADTSAKTITINAKDTTYSDATTSASGLMSSSDKTKLNGIASGAEVNVQSDWNVTDSSSDAYIKNKPSIPVDSNLVHKTGDTMSGNLMLNTGAYSTSPYLGFTNTTGTGSLSKDSAALKFSHIGTNTNYTLTFPTTDGEIALKGDIPTTYLKSASASGNTLTLTKQDNTTFTYTPSFTDTNQKVKAGSVTFDANDVVNFVGSGIVSVTGDATNDKITISASHQSIKSLNTNNTSAQTASSSEAITGSGTINLHKIAKTGTYSDLIGKPSIPDSDSDLTNDRYVRYDTNSQGLTDTQKSNARTNIGAGTYSKPSTGIPVTDLDAATQSAVVRATTAYVKPSGGIPDSDLAEGKVSKIGDTMTGSLTLNGGSGYTSSPSLVFVNHSGNSYLYKNSDNLILNQVGTNSYTLTFQAKTGTVATTSDLPQILDLR